MKIESEGDLRGEIQERFMSDLVNFDQETKRKWSLMPDYMRDICRSFYGLGFTRGFACGDSHAND